MRFDEYITHTNFKRKASTFHEKQHPNKTEDKFVPNKWDDKFRAWAAKPPEVVEKPKPKVKTTMLVNTITNTEGLNRAYHQGDFYVHGNTLYIAGSHTARDWYDDFTKVPAWGDLRNSVRYQRALDALKNNPRVDTVIGHSLGGSVALELEKNHPQVKHSRVYGAPVFEPLGDEAGKVERYRNWLDPVSVADRSAVMSSHPEPFSNASLTHDYSNMANNFISKRSTEIIDDTNDRWDVRTE